MTQTIVEEAQGVGHHPLVQQLTNGIGATMQDPMVNFTALLIMSEMLKLPGALGVKVLPIGEKSAVPINMYALACAPSGSGKSRALQSLVRVTGGFYHEYKTVRVDHVERVIEELANSLIDRFEGDYDAALEAVKFQSDTLGRPPQVFKTATTAAYTQLIQSLMFHKIGSANLVVDEIGSNILNAMDALTSVLVAYDAGAGSDSLLKHTKDNQRVLVDPVPVTVNVLLFGTASKIEAGGAVQHMVSSYMEEGFARRACMCKEPAPKPSKPKSAEDRLSGIEAATTTYDTSAIARTLTSLCAQSTIGGVLSLSRGAKLAILEYDNYAVAESKVMGVHDHTAIAERLGTMLPLTKLAAGMAFLDNAPEVERKHVLQCISWMELRRDSLHHFTKKQPAHAILANYLVGKTEPVAESTLVADLDFFKGTPKAKEEMMKLATAYGGSVGIRIHSTQRGKVTMWAATQLHPAKSPRIGIIIAEVAKATSLPVPELVEFIKGEGTFCAFPCAGKPSAINSTNKGNIVAFKVQGTSIGQIQALMSGYQYYAFPSSPDQEWADKDIVILMPLSHDLPANNAQYGQFLRNLGKWLPFQMVLLKNSWSEITGHKDVVYNSGDKILTNQFIDSISGNGVFTGLSDEPINSRVIKWYLNYSTDPSECFDALLDFLLKLKCSYDGAVRQLELLNCVLTEPFSDHDLHSTYLFNYQDRLTSEET